MRGEDDDGGTGRGGGGGRDDGRQVVGFVCPASGCGGAVVFRFNGRLVPAAEATKEALQVGADLFLESNPEAAYENCLNHSCRPNCQIVFDEESGQVYLVALRDIDDGEELSFDYLTTEFDLVGQECAFACQCGSVNCRGEIRGFAYLLADEQAALKPHLSPYLQAMMASR